MQSPKDKQPQTPGQHQQGGFQKPTNPQGGQHQQGQQGGQRQQSGLNRPTGTGTTTTGGKKDETRK